MIRIKITDITERNNADYAVKIHEILDLMAANPGTFPTPSPALADIELALETFTNLMVAAENGDRIKIAQRNEQRTVVTGMVINLAGYVAYTVRNAPNAKTLIESVGFVPAKTKGHVGELEIPEDLQSAVRQEPGSVALKWKAVYGANSYVIEITQGNGPSAVWDEIATVTRSKHNVMGLTPGQFYSFRVRAVGAAGYSEPSDITTSVVG